MTAALVVLNAAAGGGRSAARWERVRPVLSERLRLRVVRMDQQGRWIRAITRELEAGTRVFFAAGGDGTVHHLVNALLRVRRGRSLGDLTLGAAGLGSSNDFHKPAAGSLYGIPLKQDVGGSRPRDVCRARYRDVHGTARQRHFLVSASVGLCAEANALFNHPDPILRGLKPRCTSLAIGYAALKTLSAQRGMPATLSWPAGTRTRRRRVQLTNLSVLKTPHLSGGLRFDTRAAPDDGLLGINLCAGLSRAQSLRALIDLSQGRFLGRRGRTHWQAPRLRVDSPHPVALELDGEVVLARDIELAVLRERISVCA